MKLTLKVSTGCESDVHLGIQKSMDAPFRSRYGSQECIKGRSVCATRSPETLQCLHTKRQMAHRCRFFSCSTVQASVLSILDYCRA